MEKGEILHNALIKYGCLEQSLQAVEECAELIQAINKIRRMGGINFDQINKPNETSNVSYCLAYNNLCGEVADVKIMIGQLEAMLDIQTVQLIEERKISRLKERLKL